jgi:hypothetical protein
MSNTLQEMAKQKYHDDILLAFNQMSNKDMIEFIREVYISGMEQSGMAKLIEALKKISNPLGYLQEMARRENAKLDGMAAMKLIEDHHWYKQIATEALSHFKDGKIGWLGEKPEFKEECVFVTATQYNRNDEDLEWNFSVWQIKKLDGETDEGEPCWYLGLLNGDGEEWGDINDLSVDKYLIIPSPPINTKLNEA